MSFSTLLSLAWWILLMPLCSLGSNKDQDICDDGLFETNKDLGGEENWKCTKKIYPTTAYYLPAGEGYCNSTEHMDTTPKCMDVDMEDMEYKGHPPSYGHYRYVVPRYGEYKYLPPQRWLHTLKTRGVAFLYHPCANQEQVDLLKDFARRCLSPYVLTPYSYLTEEKPLAVVTWGCVYQMHWVSPQEIIEWLLDRDITFTNDRDENNNNNAVYEIGLIPPQDPAETFDPLCLDKPKDEGEPNSATLEHNTLPERDDLPTSQPLEPCKSSEISTSSNLSSEESNHHHTGAASKYKCRSNTVHITLQQHGTGLVVLSVLLCGVLVACLALILFKGVYSWKQRRPKYHRYKSVSRYFPFTYGNEATDVIIPELGLPKSGLAERETLLNESDEDEL